LISLGIGSRISLGATLLLHPATPLVTPGTRLNLRVDTLGSNGQPASTGAVTWTVKPGTGSATLDSNGVLEGVSPGTVTVTATTNDGSVTATGYVLSPAEGVQLGAPAVDATANQTIFIPIILSSSDAFTDAAFTLRLVSSDPSAPALFPTNVQPAENATVLSASPSADGLQVKLHWSAPAKGPLVLANATLALPNSFAKDTAYAIQLSQASLTLASGTSQSVQAGSGTLNVRVANPGPANKIAVTPDGVTLYVGQTQSFLATATDADGNRISGSTVTWSVLSSNVGSIDETGVFHAAAPGQTLIQAKSGILTALASVTVLDGPAPEPEIVVAPSVSATAGEVAEIPILFGNVQGLGGLTFNVNIQSPTGAALPTFLDPLTGPLAAAAFMGANVQADGSQSIAFLASKDISGPGVLLILRVQIPATARGGDRYQVQLDGLDVSDGRGQVIPAAAVSGEIAVRDDQSPPSVTIASLSPGSVVSGIVNLLVNVSDNQNVAKVELLVDGTVVTSSAESPFTLAWDTTHSAAGAHLLQVRALDASGNVGQTDQVNVVVDNDLPTAILTSPKIGATVKGSVTLTGTAADANFKSYRLHAALEDTPAQLFDVTAPTTQPINDGTLGVWDTTQVADGNYIVHLVVEDKGGNIADTSILVSVANSTPQIQFVNPPTAPVKGSLGLIVEATNGTLLNSVDFSVDDGPATRLTTAPYIFSLNTASLSNGPHTIRAVGTNPGGATGEATLSLVVDNSAPTLDVLSPSDNGRISGSASIKVKVVDTTEVSLDASVGAGSSPVSFTPIQEMTVPVGADPVTIPWNTLSLPEGAYTLRIVATDAAGNAVEKRVRVTIDRTLPSLLVNAPKTDIYTGDQVLVDADAADAGGLASLTVAVDSQTLLQTSTPPLRQNLPIRALPEGVHTLTITATDLAGNVASSTFNLTVDHTAPVVSFASPLPNASLSGDVTIIGTVKDNISGGLANYHVDIGAGESPAAFQSILNGDGEQENGPLGTFSVNGLPAGVYTLRLAATDKAGNSSTAHVVVSVGLGVKKGDVNNDGKVNVQDATLVLRAAVGLVTLSPAQAAAADVITDGKVNVSDATRILRMAVGLQ
jgi:hypothetical protein